MSLNEDDKILKPAKPIHASDNSETLICNRCREAYLSRGKYDTGYCQECERKYRLKNSIVIGGPLNGKVVG